jgi:Zn-dependent M16 (insulinase) family peptidase
MKNERTSVALTSAESRINGLKAIDPALDFGNDRSVAALIALVEKLRAKLAAHNEIIAALDASRVEVKEIEEELNTLSNKLAKGVEFEFGADSREFELIGGVKTSDRVRKAVITRLKGASDEDADETPKNDNPKN